MKPETALFFDKANDLLRRAEPMLSVAHFVDVVERLAGTKPDGETS